MIVVEGFAGLCEYLRGQKPKTDIGAVMIRTGLRGLLFYDCDKDVGNSGAKYGSLW